MWSELISQPDTLFAVFKLSKESQLTFLGLLAVPIFWIVLNHFGFLDYLKMKTLDWRMNWPRGEISHRAAANADDNVTVENNQSVPRVPKVMYVNFDSDTLAMNEVGERPWDRAFFRDVSQILLQRGKARVVAFDFVFSSKSMSSMVPEENVYRSDAAIAELITNFPKQVVLGATFSGVQTSLMKPYGKFPGVKAHIPLFKEGYQPLANDYRYPEAPTYPMQSYVNGNHLGRIGPIDIRPSDVDGMPRMMPLWYPGGGEAQAYNVLGGKRIKLALDLRNGVTKETEQLKAQIAILDESIGDVGETEELKSQIAELDKAIGNFKNTLKENPAIASVVEPQIKVREDKRELLTVKLSEFEQGLKIRKTEREELVAQLADLERDLQDSLEPTGSIVDPDEIGEMKAHVAELDKTIDQFKKTLKANPAIAAVVEPQLKNREEERRGMAQNLTELEARQRRLVRLRGDESTELKVVGDKLQLVYSSPKGEGNGTLVESLPNEMPLNRDRRFFALGLETLLAYYGLADKDVKISQDGKRLQLVDRAGDVLINAPLTDGQFVEVNWFSKWSERIPEVVSLREARRLYGDERFEEYVALCPDIIRGFLSRVKDVEVPKDDVALLQSLADLGVEPDHVVVAGQLLEAASGELDPEQAPSYEKLNALCGTIAYYFIPPSLKSPLNPMCGMNDVLDFDRHSRERQSELLQANKTIELIKRKSLSQAREILYKFSDEVEAKKLWKEIDSLKVRVSNLDKSFQTTSLPTIEDQLNKSQAEYDELLKKLDEIENRTLLADVNFSEVSTIEEAQQAEVDLRRTGSKLNDLNSEIDGSDKTIDNLRKTLKDNPTIAAVVEPQLKAGEAKRIDAVSKFREQAAVYLVKLKSILRFNQSKKQEILSDFKRINSFFEKFEDAIVFIGPVEPTFQDLSVTPFDTAPVPKVSVHGNVVKTLTSGLYLKRPPDWVDHVTTFGLCLLMAFLAVYSGPKASWVQTGGVCLQAGYVLVAFYAFSKTHVLWPVTTPACAGFSTTFVGLGVMLVIEQKAKGRLKGMFGSYVSSDLVDQMVESGEEPSLGGEETQITAYFSDVQAFSSFSELLGPTGLVDLMNEYLTAMTNILQEERGTLDKYIGDAIVAMYGAPIPMADHAYQSVRTALLMQARQLELREKWAGEEDKWGACHQLVSQMQTRIGCNTGTATVGNMGALDRFNYTMMGDMVNLAARCESGAKAYGAYIMITEETKDASVATKDDIAFRYLDKIIVKGRTQPVAMYEPTGFMADLTQETEDCLDCFEQGIKKYLAQDWNGALKMFEKAKELEPNKPGVTPGVKDNPSIILLDRCNIMKDNPPGDDWDGVYVMTTK